MSWAYVILYLPVYARGGGGGGIEGVKTLEAVVSRNDNFFGKMDTSYISSRDERRY